jgi:hydroxymethylglutaryl-CoA lyase
MKDLKLIECPRDAMQGLAEFVPTQIKAEYINLLLKCGFDTLDFGSFVSPKAIPQMRDTADVLNRLELSGSTKLLAIIANERGAQDAVSFEEIAYLGYPFSVSEEFQKRNTNSTIAESFKRLENIHSICAQNGKSLVVYLSMGFGNPYGETWNAEIVTNWSERLFKELDIRILALSDTIGAGTPEVVSYLFEHLTPALPEVEFGAHLHVRADAASEMIAAAYSAGCRRFDSAIKGFGGCPMAKDDLTGNMPTEKMLEWFRNNNVPTGLDSDHFKMAFDFSSNVFKV